MDSWKPSGNAVRSCSMCWQRPPEPLIRCHLCLLDQLDVERMVDASDAWYAAEVERMRERAPA